jgi:fatty-acyl-CoA synthase
MAVTGSGVVARAGRNTIGDALRRSAARFRNRDALEFAGRRWTFAALDLAADRVARRLLAAGLSPGDRVVAHGRNSDATSSPGSAAPARGWCTYRRTMP